MPRDLTNTTVFFVAGDILVSDAIHVKVYLTKAATATSITQVPQYRYPPLHHVKRTWPQCDDCRLHTQLQLRLAWMMTMIPTLRRKSANASFRAVLDLCMRCDWNFVMPVLVDQSSKANASDTVFAVHSIDSARVSLLTLFPSSFYPSPRRSHYHHFCPHQWTHLPVHRLLRPSTEQAQRATMNRIKPTTMRVQLAHQQQRPVGPPR
jgi:hypothetical protein